MKTFKRLGVWAFGRLDENLPPTRSYSHTLISRVRGDILRGLLITLIAGLSTGCAYYSFTGASIPSQLNTIAIPLTVDNSANPINTLDRTLTQLLIDRFVEQTRLSLETNESDADARLTTRIQGYENRPTSVSGQERATLNRVTIRVAVEYYDQVEDKELMTQTFSNYGEYDPAEGLEGERAAAQEAIEKIAEDIFSQATSNW